MTTESLVDELTTIVGSRREASWLAHEVAPLPGAQRAARGRELALRRAGGEPIQYVIGHWPFRTLDVVTDRRALIPRPETEQLVGLALERLDPSRDAAVVDLGCGSGVIALSLAVEGAARGSTLDVHATDVDPAAIALARANAARVGAVGVSFHAGSWLDALPPSLEGSVGLICSNPPYVAASERPGLARELDYEPPRALVADDLDGTPGFADVARVIRGGAGWLRPGGWLLVEHGAGHRAAALDVARDAGLVDVEDLDDLAGLPRFLIARAG